MSDNRRALLTVYEDELVALNALPACDIQNTWQEDWEEYSIRPYASSPLEELFNALINYQMGVPAEEIKINDSGAKVLFAIKTKELDEHD